MSLSIACTNTITIVYMSSFFIVLESPFEVIICLSFIAAEIPVTKSQAIKIKNHNNKHHNGSKKLIVLAIIYAHILSISKTFSISIPLDMDNEL